MILVHRVKNHEQHKLELVKRINKYEDDENMRWDHYYGDFQVSPFVDESEAPEYMKYFYDNMADDIMRSKTIAYGIRDMKRKTFTIFTTTQAVILLTVIS